MTGPFLFWRSNVRVNPISQAAAGGGLMTRFVPFQPAI
jgi:hypothetical protein